MPDDKSLDLTGIGKMANAIPPEAWKASAEAATVTVQQIISPLTASTSGVARLIEGYFERLVDVQKINTAEVLRRTREKIEKSGKPTVTQIEPRVLVTAIENAGLQTDPTLSELWSNLLAQEFTGGVHPEIPRILARLTVEDANTFAEIVASQDHVAFHAMRQALTNRHSDALAVRSPIMAAFASQEPSLSQSVLAGNGLIANEDSGWMLTVLGKAFVKAVTDPSMEGEKGASAPPK